MMAKEINIEKVRGLRFILGEYAQCRKSFSNPSFRRGLFPFFPLFEPHGRISFHPGLLSNRISFSPTFD